ncbi:MAG: hypothetical protein ABI723_06930 [Bacteroidia bacterium]
MKNFKTIFFAFLFAFVFSNSNAQQAQTADFIGTWTGADNKGNSYTLILGEAQSCELKVNNSVMTVKWWKLVSDAQGNILFQKNHATIRLITNTSIPSPVSSMPTSLSTGTGNGGFKTYLADAIMDPTFTSMQLTVDFINGTSASTGFSADAVTITLNK